MSTSGLKVFQADKKKTSAQTTKQVHRTHSKSKVGIVEEYQ